MTENLFFAIFGQKDTDDFTVSLKRKLQPLWTIYLFKVSFSLYMLVSVIVLINLLIAMMSDTYQNIQSQSDIEWKYGLSKLIRKMQKTRTAPSPLNLITSWTIYLGKACKNSLKTKRKASVMRLLVEHRNMTGQTFDSDPGMSSPPRGNINFPLFPNALDGQTLGETARIENIVDWDVVRQKYRVRFMGEIEKPAREEETMPVLNGNL